MLIVKDLSGRQKGHALIMNKVPYDDIKMMMNDVEAVRIKSNTTYNNELLGDAKLWALPEYK